MNNFYQDYAIFSFNYVDRTIHYETSNIIMDYFEFEPMSSKIRKQIFQYNYLHLYF